MRRGSLLVAAAGIVLSGFGTAGAKPVCVTVSGTAPVVGTFTKTQCSPSVSQLVYDETVYDCHWIPPAGVSWCVTLRVPLPV